MKLLILIYIILGVQVTVNSVCVYFCMNLVSAYANLREYIEGNSFYEIEKKLSKRPVAINSLVTL